MKIKNIYKDKSLWRVLSVAILIIGLVFAFIANAKLIQPAHAATGINQQLNYQGRLMDITGAIVADGTYNMEFKIYQDGTGCVSGGTPPCSGTLKWTETRTTTDKVTVTNGFFSVALGSVTAFGTSVDWNQDTLWLSINIGGTGSPSWDGEMTPFRRLTAVPYAFNARQLGGIDWDRFVQIAPSAVQTDTSLDSMVFLNKTGASGNIMQLQKNASDVFTIGNTGATTLADDLAINGGDLTTSASTFNLLNSTATTINFGGAATAMTLGAAGGLTITPGGNLTVAEGNTKSTTFTSDLTGGARSTNLLTLSQANDATFNSSGNMLRIDQLDTATTGAAVFIDNNSTAAGGYGLVVDNANTTTTGTAIRIVGVAGANVRGLETSGITSGTALLVNSVTTGTAVNANGVTTGTALTATGVTTGIGLNVTATTTGRGLVYNTTANTLTTGSGLTITGAAAGITADYTGAYINVTPTRTLTAAATRTDSGNFLNIDRSNTVNNAGATYNITGALVDFSSTCTQTAGTCTDSANILNIAQNYANASGALLNIAGAGTGDLATMDATNASANGVSIDVQSSSSSQYALRVTSNNGATNDLYVRADGNVGIGTAAPNTKLEVAGLTVNTEGIRMNDGTDTVGWFIVNANPNGSVTGTRGSLAMDYTNGVLYINTNDSTGWTAMQTTSGSCTSSTTIFCQGGNSFGATAVLGTNDSNSLTFETNNITQASIAVGGAVTFQNSTDSTTGFRVMDADGGDPILNVDTTNERVGVGVADPDSKLEVQYASSSASGAIAQGLKVGASHTGALAAGNDYLYGGIITAERTGAVGGTTETKALLVQATGDAGGTSTAYGIQVQGGQADTSYAIHADAYTALSGAATSSTGIYAKSRSLTSGTLTSNYGIYVDTATTTGTMTDNYGLLVKDQTAATNDYGIAIEGADTYALWVGSGANNTDAANGITFGLSGDTNLYRSAANELKTDDVLAIGTLGSADNATYLCRNSSNQISTCNSTGAGVAWLQGGNSFGATGTLGTNDSNGLAFETNNLTQATIAVGGATVFQNTTDSTTGFQVKDADGGTPVFNIDTTNERVGIGTATPANLLTLDGNGNVTGKMAFGPNAQIDQSIIAEYSGDTFDTVLNIQKEFTTFSSDFAGGITNHTVLNASSDASNVQYTNFNEVRVKSGNVFNYGGIIGNSGVTSHEGSGIVSVAGGDFLVLQNMASGTITTAFGSNITVENESNGVLTNAIGVSGSVNNNTGSTGSIGSAYAGKFSISNAVGSTITTGVGLHVDSSNNGAAMTTYYGLYLAADNAIATTSYGIYNLNQELTQITSTTASQVNDGSGNSIAKINTTDAEVTFNESKMGQVDSWSTASNALPAVRQNHATASYNGYLYAVGGSDGSTLQTTVYYAKVLADGSPDTWNTTTAISTATENHRVVATNGYLYLLGGSTGSTVSTVSYAKINSDGTLGSWSTTTSLPAVRQTFVADVYNGYIYVVGGWNGSAGQTTIYYARPSANGTISAWTTASNPLPTAAYRQVGGVVNGYLYSSMGVDMGRSKLGDDGAPGTWTTQTSYFFLVGADMDAFIGNGKLYTAGGNFFGCTTGVNYSTPDSTGAMTATGTDSLPAARCNPKTTVENGYAYAIGGENSGAQSTVYYSSLPRTAINGSLDLVSLSGLNTTDTGGLSTLYAGDISAVGNISAQGDGWFGGGLVVNNASILRGETRLESYFAQQNTTDSATAFQIFDADGGTAVLSVDTVDERVGIGGTPANGLLTIGTGTTTAAGGLYFGTDTNLYRGAADFLYTDDSVRIGANQTFLKEVAHSISVEQSTTAATAGAALSITAGAGSATTSGAGGALNLTGGAGVAGNSTGGAVNIVGGAGVGVASGGGVVITGGANLTGGNVTINAGSGVADGNIRLATSDGMVSIGSTSTPTAMLHVRARIAATTTLEVDNLTNTGAIAEFKDNGTVVASLANGGAALFQNVADTTTGFQIKDADGGTSIFNIDTTNERVGIGTDSPGVKLDVTDSQSASNVAAITNSANAAGANGLNITAGENTYSTGSNLITFKRPDGTTIGSVAQNASTTVAYNTTSDARLKENITETDMGLGTVLQLKIYDYNYKDDANQTKLTGFLAQELYNLFPGAVTVGNDEVDANGNLVNPWAVDYGKLTPLLAKGIQDLNTKVDALEAKVNSQGVAQGVFNGGIVTEDVEFQGLATFDALTTFRGQAVFLGGAEFNAPTTFKDRIVVSSNTAGKIKILAGLTKIEVVFSKPYAKVPIVNVTPVGIIQPKFGVVNTTVNGFEIQIDPAQAADVEFNWFAVEAQ